MIEKIVGSCHDSCQIQSVASRKKIQRFRISEFTNASGTVSWRISGSHSDGTRVRQNFADKVDALRKLGDLEMEVHGNPEPRKSVRTLLSPEEVSEAEVAVQQLEGEGLTNVVAHYLQLRARTRSKGVELDAAIAFFEAHYREEVNEISILNAKNEFLESRGTIAAATKANYEIGLKLLLYPDPNKLIHKFTIKDLEEILKKYRKRGSQRTFRTMFSTFFEWAVRHHYCLENPCKRFDKLPKDNTKIAALSLDEVKRLLFAATQKYDGVAVASVAIGLFAGLRPSEIRDLTGVGIGNSVISVSGGKLRRILNRKTPIPPVLTKWLEKYPFKGFPDGWDSKIKGLKKATKAKRWVSDIIRHTSISFQAERDRNEALTAFNCGTSVEMLNRHYRHSIDDDELVTAFWELTPERLFANKPDVLSPARKRVKWPAKPDLQKLVMCKPMVEAAKDLGVSDVALRKYCVKLEVALPKRGFWSRTGNQMVPKNAVLAMDTD